MEGVGVIRRNWVIGIGVGAVVVTIFSGTLWWKKRKNLEREYHYTQTLLEKGAEIEALKGKMRYRIPKFCQQTPAGRVIKIECKNLNRLQLGRVNYLLQRAPVKRFEIMEKNGSIWISMEVEKW